MSYVERLQGAWVTLCEVQAGHSPFDLEYNVLACAKLVLEEELDKHGASPPENPF